jgi:serine/threonine protein kinase
MSDTHKYHKTTIKTWGPVTKAQEEEKEQNKPKSKPENKISIDKFILERLIGQGAYGMVYLAKHIETGKYCALKQLDKKVIRKLGKDEHAKIEKKILTTVESPFLLKAICTWQETQIAWLALEYCPGGDLREFLEVINCFEEEEAKLYFAEMIVAVHDLHCMGYIHRDLKPPNFLIDKSGHIKLADFGLSKAINAVGKMKTVDDEASAENLSMSQAELDERKQKIWKRNTKYDRATLSPSNFHDLFKINHPMKKTSQRLSARINKEITIKVIPDKKELRREYGHSIVGSPEYMSPEITEGRHQGGSYYGEEVDWWSLGCVFFEMIFGAPPFQGDTVEELFSQIDLWNDKLPSLFEEHKEHLSPACYSLLTGFLCDPKQRLGREIDKIKSHVFFAGMDWSNLLSMTPPFIPQTPPEMSYMSK